jgi:nitrate reductase gamma subunit
VLTTVWCELMADPNLFKFRKLVISRDHKIIAVTALILGAFLSRACLQATGSAVTLGVAAGLRAVIGLSFLWVRGKAV